jgi:glycosyltransferase involved in cell wall biosynthesis
LQLNKILERKIIMPYISIIIPVYNTAYYLPRCLDSCINQTFKDIELVCINDGSTDNSLEILLDYERADKRVHVINFSGNRKASSARNAGIKAAAGTYLGFVDSDDYVDLDFYNKLAKNTDNGDADIVKGNARCFYGNNSIRITNNAKIASNKFEFKDCFWSAIYKKQLCYDNKIGFLEGFEPAEDIIFLIMAVAQANTIKIVDNVFYNYIRRDDSACKSINYETEIHAILKARFYIIEYINSISIDIRGYITTFTEQFEQSQALYSTVNIDNQEAISYIIAKNLLNLYSKCKYKNDFISTQPYTSRCYIMNKDLHGLVAYLRTPANRRIPIYLRSCLQLKSE